MKRVLISLVVAGILSGCAPAPYTKADIDGKIVCNADYMNAVERQARRENKVVLWVHCPEATLRVVS